MDKAAAECRRRRGGGRGREEHWRLRRLAAAWELGAIQASASAGALLHDKLRAGGLRPRERRPCDDSAGGPVAASVAPLGAAGG